jgi:hypothetical protein
MASDVRYAVVLFEDGDYYQGKDLVVFFMPPSLEVETLRSWLVPGDSGHVERASLVMVAERPEEVDRGFVARFTLPMWPTDLGGEQARYGGHVHSRLEIFKPEFYEAAKVLMDIDPRLYEET